MEDVHEYSLDEIYTMIKEHSISLDDLAEYITEVVPQLEVTEELKEFLDAADTYIDQIIKSGMVEDSEIAVEEIKEVETVNPNDGSNVDGNNNITEIETEEKIPVPVVENSVVEEYTTNIEQPEIVTDNEYPYFDSDNNSYEEAKKAVDETYNYCQDAGMTIEEISLSGRNGRGPYISFEINNESKQFLNHLMNEFYQSNDGISLEFMRDLSTRSEFFTIEINSASMSQEEFFTLVRNTFDRIYHTIETTRRDYDYENAMPDGLKSIKERFRNDDPDINQDFTIGYVRNDGKDSYYIVADDSAQAIEYARSIGYDIKSRNGANIYEIDIESSTIDTKLADASVDLSSDKEALDIKENGVANLDIYGSLLQDPKVEMIENFIETSNDPHIMCMLAIEIPPENSSQRIVTMKTEMGGSETVIFTDGQKFDNMVFPRIIDTYVDNNPINKEDIHVDGADAFDSTRCQIETENNTTMVIDGYTENEVNKIINNIESKSNAVTQSEEKDNTKQKSIGPYQNNNSNNQIAAFVSMPVLFVICILFILMISLIIFAN